MNQENKPQGEAELDLVEKAITRALELQKQTSAPKWTFYLSLTTALIAMFAAVGSLKSGGFTNQALFLKNEAVLNQARASDQWAYYQAKGIKAINYTLQADAEEKARPDLSEKYRAEAKRYKTEQEEISARAKDLEKKVEDAGKESEERLRHSRNFGLSVTFFQVTIALSAIAALTRRKLLWIVGLVISGGGVAYFCNGFFVWW